ncbi:hypothetical protein WJX74_001078 [Apatococcus lobatus]|uniref:Uncharacterized protein n=1 Tax=Apatococcus lobatus TaxID=904363 RepID=A0AAW1R2Y4_9CHLO
MLPRAGLRHSGWLCALRFSTVVTAASSVPAVKEALEWALSSAEYTTESASQAYLEADPAKRGPKVTYLLRYQQQAQQEIHKALRMYDELDEHSQTESKADKEFAILHADTMLARDKLADIIEGHEKRLTAEDAAQQLTAKHTNI